ncbi:MAG: ion transporter [Planctomycetota bacterium]
MPSLKQVIEQRDTRIGRGFDYAVQGLIVLSLVAFSVETLPDLGPVARRWLNVGEAVIVGLFTIEYLAWAWVATPTRRYIFSFYGLVDLCAILPFYLTAGIDLRSVRALRLLRLFRLFKLVRYSAAMRRFHTALLLAKEEIVLFLCLTLILLFLAAVGIYHFEHEAQPEAFASVFHSLWWAVATMTTVGYGDVYPITVGGRVFTFFVLLMGLGVIAVPTGLVASALTQARRLEAEEKNADGGDEARRD